MPTVIPPIPLTDRTPAEFLSLRNLFRLAGVSEATVCERLSLARLSGLQPELVRQRDSGPLRNASDALIRLFVEGWPVAKSELDRTLTAEGVALLEHFRLLMPHGADACSATVSLYPIENLYVASDRYNNADGSLYVGWDDLVYPCLFATTRKFIETVPRTPTTDVLDLCAGTGVGALLLAANATYLMAADVTPRCDEFIRFNALLNGFPNVEAGTGDLYAPAKGRQFDRIVVHPPYQPVIEHIATFNSGGADGEQITRRIIEGAPSHLKPGGQLFCLCQLTDREDPVEHRIRGWMTEEESNDCDVAFLVYKHHDVMRYTAIETLQEKKGYGAWKAWTKAFSEAGVREMVYGMLVLQRREAGSARHVFTVRRDGPASGAEELVAMIRWETESCRPDFAERAMALRPRASAGSEMQVGHVLAGGKWNQAKLKVSRSRPFEIHLEIDPVTANLLAMMDGSKTVAELRASLPFDVPAGQMASLIRMLASNGLIEIG